MKLRFATCVTCGPCVRVDDEGVCIVCGKKIIKAVEKVRDVVSFRPHYNSSLGCFVESEADMQRKAEKLGVERYGYPIQMRRG